MKTGKASLRLKFLIPALFCVLWSSGVVAASGQEPACATCGPQRSPAIEPKLPEIVAVVKNDLLDCAFGAPALDASLHKKNDRFVGYLPNSAGAVLIYGSDGLYVYTESGARYFPVPAPTSELGSHFTRNFELPISGLKSYFIAAGGQRNGHWAETRLVHEKPSSNLKYTALKEKQKSEEELHRYLKQTTIRFLQFVRPATPEQVEEFSQTRILTDDRMGARVEKPIVEYWKNTLRACAQVTDPDVRALARKRLSELFPGQK